MLNLPANGNGQPAPTLAPQPVPQQAPPTLNPGAMYPGSFAPYQIDINGMPLGQPGQAAPVQPGQMPQPMPGPDQPAPQPAIDPTIMQTAQQLGVDPAAVARVLQTHQGLQPAEATPPAPAFDPELDAQHRALDGERLTMEANNVRADIQQRAQAMLQQKISRGMPRNTRRNPSRNGCNRPTSSLTLPFSCGAAKRTATRNFSRPWP